MQLHPLSIAFDGLVGSSLMFALMWVITNSGLANCNMVAAIGSMLTSDRNREGLLGFSIYILGGLLFAAVYNVLLTMINIQSATLMIGASIFIGFAHGLVVSFAIIAIFSERHLDTRFQNASIGIGIAHLIAHMLYGLSIGVLFCLRMNLISSTVLNDKSPLFIYSMVALAALPFIMSIFSIDKRLHNLIVQKKHI